jgi:hypothetical protein
MDDRCSNQHEVLIRFSRLVMSGGSFVKAATFLCQLDGVL